MNIQHGNQVLRVPIVIFVADGVTLPAASMGVSFGLSFILQDRGVVRTGVGKLEREVEPPDNYVLLMITAIRPLSLPCMCNAPLRILLRC